MTARISEIEHQRLLTALPVGLLGLDADWSVVHVEGLAEDMLASSQRLLLGIDVADLPDIGKPLDIMRVELQQDARASVRFLGHELPDGSIIDLHLQTLPPSSSADREMTIAHMLTLIGQGRTQEQHAGDRASASERSMRGLAAMLAHEIKNPLAGIRGAAQLCERSIPSDKQHLTALIVDEVERIKGLLDAFDQPGSGSSVIDNGSNIHDVLNHVMELVRHDPGFDVSLHAVFDPSLPPVNGTRDALVQIFLNLAQNGAIACGRVQEGGDKGRISFTTRYRQGAYGQTPDGRRCRLSIEVEVSDTGAGIDPALQPYIFEPFVTSREAGSGLGLATVSQLLYQIGGRISIKESNNTGTTFALLLPEFRGQQRDDESTLYETAS